MADLSRRDFLKVVSLTGSSAVIGCSSKSAQKLIPYIFPPEDIIPGKASWYASICRECPAGCGILVRNREGRVVKLEGNPLHPVNKGKLCARGQAALQGLYNPDRIKQPLLKNQKGSFESITWEQAEALLLEKLQQIKKAGKHNSAVFLSTLENGTLRDLILQWLAELNSDSFMPYEPFAYEPLRRANQGVFNIDGIPAYRIDHADFLISFGADFLETWLSPVEYSRQFAFFHAPQDNSKHLFVFVGPRQSLTAANADQWVCVPPGTEYLAVLGMIRVMIEEDMCDNLSAQQKELRLAQLKDFSMESITGKTGCSRQTLYALAKHFSRARKPLALAGGMGAQSTAAAVAANLLNTFIPGSAELIDLEAQAAVSAVVSADAIKDLTGRMRNREVDLLLINQTNPVFSLPPSLGFPEDMKEVPFVVSFSSTLDETSAYAHLILPANTPLESWGDYAPRKDILGLLQPVMGTLYNTRHLGDILLTTGKKLSNENRFPWHDFYGLLRDTWEHKTAKNTTPAQTWEEAMQRGGLWADNSSPAPAVSQNAFQYSFPPPDLSPNTPETVCFITYPTIQFFDGRGANRPWLQELPDPLTQVTWGNWFEIHPDTAQKLSIKDGDLVNLQSPHGTVEAPAYVHHGISPGTVAMPLGQGHTNYGRFADNRSHNPLNVLPGEPDPSSKGIILALSGVTLTKKDAAVKLAHTDGSRYQFKRELAQSVSAEEYQKACAAGHAAHLRLPLPEGYDPAIDFYPPHQHKDYRWCMVIDLDRCTGCGACVVACYAENNVAVVGREQVIKEREMSWLRIQRYFEQDGPGVHFLPMLCQHCDSAPCESVCPVYAPHHSIEGLNNQIYNRCIGTRFCSQNCPYKVRRFNYFTYSWAEPLNWELNPDVTVRQKGVMEKCSFCVQRIKEAKNTARDESRTVRDGEVTPACVQTCPADALIFGSLLDPQSRVSKLIQDPRAYQVLEHLNTKPAVIYLKKIINQIKV